MNARLTPGVYIDEISGGVRPIEGIGTSTTGFIGVTMLLMQLGEHPLRRVFVYGEAPYAGTRHLRNSF